MNPWNIPDGSLLHDGEARRKELVGRPRREWEDDIKMEWGGMYWIDLARERNQWRALVNRFCRRAPLRGFKGFMRMLRKQAVTM
jgi:hypothetical protein